jgi:hypothetical protein
MKRASAMFEDRFSDPASQTNLSTGNVGIDVAGVTLGATHPYATAADGTAVPVGGQLQQDHAGALLEAGLRRVADPLLDQRAGQLHGTYFIRR